MTAITAILQCPCYIVKRPSGCKVNPVGRRTAMKGKIAYPAALMLAIALTAAPARADTVRVTVRAPDGRPAAGVAVTVRQAAGYATASGDVAPPAIVGEAMTTGDGTASFHLADPRPFDVYSIGADDDASGRHASLALFAATSEWPAPTMTLGAPAPPIVQERAAAGAAAASCDRTG